MKKWMGKQLNTLGAFVALNAVLIIIAIGVIAGFIMGEVEKINNRLDVIEKRLDEKQDGDIIYNIENGNISIPVYKERKYAL